MTNDGVIFSSKHICSCSLVFFEVFSKVNFQIQQLQKYGQNSNKGILNFPFLSLFPFPCSLLDSSFKRSDYVLSMFRIKFKPPALAQHYMQRAVYHQNAKSNTQFNTYSYEVSYLQFQQQKRLRYWVGCETRVESGVSSRHIKASNITKRSYQRVIPNLFF